MSKRIATISAPADLGAAGTKTMSIKIRDLISSIRMSWLFTIVTVSVMTDNVLACIEKIELSDGGDILFSLSGEEAQALNFYDQKVMPKNAVGLKVGDICEANFDINFGRFLYDPKLALDPTKFTNLQLSIKWDEDAANGSAVVNSFAAYANIDDNPAEAPVGFLSAQEIKQYAMAASTHEYTDLPVDKDLRKILIRGLSTDHDPITLFDNLKVSADNDKEVLLDMSAAYFYRIEKLKYPRITEKYHLDEAVTAKTIYANVSKDGEIAISYDGTAFVTAQSKFAVATWAGAVIALTASVDIKGMDAVVTGECPHNSFAIDLGDPEDIDSWFKVADVGSLKADISSSSDADSGDTTFLVVQQLRKYAAA